MRIPVGDFGLRAPGETRDRSPNVAPSAFVGGGLASLKGLGELGMDVGAQLGKEAVDEAKFQAGERRRAQLEAAAEQKGIDREAKQTEAMRIHTEGVSALYKVHDEIIGGLQDGTVKRDDAPRLWQDQSQKIIDDSLEKVDRTNAEKVKLAFGSNLLQLGRQVDQAVTVKGRNEIRANVEATLEGLQREAPRDRQRAIKNADEMLLVRGPSAGMDDVEIGRRRQAFREGAAYTDAYTLVSRSADSLSALKATKERLNGDEFGDLDPQRRAALENTVRSRMEMVQRRYEVENERRQREAERQFAAFTTMTDKGITPSPEYMAQLSATFARTPYASAINEILRTQPERTGFATMPVPQQRATLDRMLTERNEKGADPRAVAQFEKLERVHKQTLADIQADPLRAALERGVIRELPPVGIEVGIPAADQVAVRRKLADTVSVWAGRDVSPFTQDEAARFAMTIEQLPVAQRANALKEFGTLVGNPGQMRALAKQMGDKHETIGTAAFLAARDVRTSNGRSLAEMYLGGDEALKEKRAKIDDKAEVGIRAQINSAVHDAYATPLAERTAADVAFKVYAQMKADGRDDWEQAVKDATGGIVKHNGAKVPLPRGFSKGEFTDAVNAMDAPTLRQAAGSDAVIVNGKAVPVSSLASQFSGARLRSAGENTYAVQVGTFVVQRMDGSPLLVTLTKPTR